MVNLRLSADEVDLWVWVDPRRHSLRTHLERYGYFDCGSASLSQPRAIFASQLPHHGACFPSAAGTGGPEEWLETVRATWFGSYPRRADSIRAFRSESSAAAYRACNLAQTRSFLLKRGSSHGPYAYSTHDPRWITHLRHSEDRPALATCFASRYWRGCSTESSVTNTGAKWPVEELLFMGRIDIYEPCLPLV